MIMKTVEAEKAARRNPNHKKFTNVLNFEASVAEPEPVGAGTFWSEPV